MEKKFRLMGFVLVIVALFLARGLLFAQDATTAPAQPGNGELEAAAVDALPGTAFTYQGELKQSGTGVSAACDFQFSLFDAASAGTQIGATQTKSNVAVSNGLFTVSSLDFGAGAFNGEARWLQIGVRCPAGAGNYTAITPRQALTPAPYALALPGFYTIQHEDSPNLIGGHSNNSVISGVRGATISGGGSLNSPNRVFDNWGTVGGGSNNKAGTENESTSNNTHATVGGGNSNTASAYVATVSGGLNNTASGENGVVGGGGYNTASGFRATVGGGVSNTASATAATVSGGSANIASGSTATVGGGSEATASGAAATVGGGYGNTASGLHATVGGGNSNTASGVQATVGGGQNNIASGSHSTVPGGLNNLALGSYSFAAGRRAKAEHLGAFVWGAGTDTDIKSPAINTFVVRAPGGIWLGTTSNPSIPGGTFLNTSTGAHLTTGGQWTNGSNRNAKENFTPVDAHSILAQVAALPITTWNYRTEDVSVRHMGPMAQDFYAAFALGADEVSIGTVDASGVALAAIQGLHQLTQAQNAEIATQETVLAAQREEIAALTERLTALERATNGNDQGLAHGLPDWLLLALGLGGVVVGVIGYSRQR
jgi:trimeric autotransporter adhesin